MRCRLHEIVVAELRVIRVDSLVREHALVIPHLLLLGPLLLLLLRPLPDKVDCADLLEALCRIGRLVRGPKAVDRESGQDVALRLVVWPVECAVRIVVVRELGADCKVEQPGG